MSRKIYKVPSERNSVSKSEIFIILEKRTPYYQISVKFPGIMISVSKNEKKYHLRIEI
jgi:hypothetical protein